MWQPLSEVEWREANERAKIEWRKLVAGDKVSDKPNILSTGSDENNTWLVGAAHVFELTNGLRWSTQDILQQAWRDQVTGEIEWRDVPREVNAEFVDAEFSKNDHEP